MTQAIDQAMQQAVERGIFPAASLLAGRRGGPEGGGEILHHSHYGKAREGTCFDIASLTKPICTATLCMISAKEGRLKLSDTVYEWLGGARQPEHRKMTVAHLLTHISGLPAWRPFYREIPMHKVGTPEARSHVVSACLQEPIFRAPGSQCEYSDLGFILLGEILQEAWGKNLDELFDEKIAKPFGLKETFFVSIQKRRTARFSPTEDCPWRGRVVKGEVHDQNAFAMGGVAGHAGLFSTTQDIHQFITHFLKNFGGESDWHPRHPSDFVLGWNTPTFGTSSAGRYFSPHSIGHSGYTGCTIWIDLDKNFWVILLTNRVHPSTANEKIKAFRPQIHNLICREFTE